MRSRKKSDHLVTLMHIVYAELGVCRSPIVVLYDGIAYIDGISGLDMVEEISHVERYGRDMMVRMRLLNEFKLEMTTFCSYLTSHSVIIYIFSKKHRCCVSRTERLELLEDTQELRRDLREVQPCIHIHYRSLHLRDYGS